MISMKAGKRRLATDCVVRAQNLESSLHREILKDPYIIRPAPLDEAATERALENALIARLKDFLLELGSGFAFLGNHSASRSNS
jgi:predicted nuclease of restriction endonuclease-like (RecB) superfamily